jgi:thiamine kinase-like enzyme
MTATAKARVEALGLWSGPVEAVPLEGGITNTNFVVADAGERFVVRVGADIPVHHVMRFNELAASRAAFLAGVSPEVVHAEPGILVLRYIEAHTCGEADVARTETLERVLPVLLRCHREIPRHLRGPVLVFWVFHVLRDYAATLRDGASPHAGALAGLLAEAERLEAAVGPVEIVFGHNDLLPANILDDGARIWLVDWDYAGFNSALFDLGGLASNSGLAPEQEEWLLEAYYDRPVTDALRRSYTAMKCASLLRETMWSMVSEIHSAIDFDYSAYTRENMARYRASFDRFKEM